jgi:predicted SprT family Zn-dependent metalloprotease
MLKETNAIELENGNYGCPKCKCDQLKMVAHADGPKVYKNIYNCVKCGTPVSFTYERDKTSQAYWGE